MGEAFVKQLLSLCLQRIALEENTNSEAEFIEVLRSFEATRKKWLHAELELKRCKELLLKSDVVRAALEVQLKHARNQVDVEIKKRYKAEADYQYLERQMQLICEILVNDSKSNACLSDEQRSMLANFNHKGASMTQHRSKRLSIIEESSFLSHSDISYDRTDDDLDLDTTVKPLRSRAREKRRSSMGPNLGVPMQKRCRLSGRSEELLSARPVEREMETTVVKASVTTPESGGQIHMVIDITKETPDKPTQTLRMECLPPAAEQTSVWAQSDEMDETVTVMDAATDEPEPIPALAFTPTVDKTRLHVFLPKTVIRPETCVPCGKRIRFGKVAGKCRDCRVVAHPECKHLCVESCSPIAHGVPQASEDILESFVPNTRPKIPALIVQCVNEIERRGLKEKGIYRVPGGERTVRELREKCVSGKGALLLSRVDDVHVVCGLLKDFLRKLREPLVTFKLHRAFMDAAETADDDESTAMMFQALAGLPSANKETLAFLILHLQRVVQSPACQMDQNNLARVFGPTLIGHGIAEPSPMTIMRDTNTQPKVIARMLSLPEDYWRGILTVARDQVISHVIDANINSAGQSTDKDQMFKPLTSPELSNYCKAPATGSLKGRIKTLGNAFNNTSKPKTDPGKRKFFTSPK